MTTPAILELGYKPPYDWSSMLAFLAARSVATVEHVWDAGYARTFTLQGVQGAFALEPIPGHRVRVSVAAADAGVVPEILSRVRRMFDLDTDPQPIDAHLRSDPVLGPLVAAHPGLRVPGAWDGFELAVRAVLGQQISVAAAQVLAGKLVRSHGGLLPGQAPQGLTLPGSPPLTHLFPEAVRLKGATLAGMPRSRAATLTAIATLALGDPGLFGPYASLQAAITRLRSMPGVGEWTAHYIAMRALREADAFPATDITIQRALADGGKRPEPPQVLARAEAWRPWRAYATLHLWAAQARGENGADTPRRAA